MTKIVILDDEKHCTDILADMISRMSENYELTGVFNDPREALEFVSSNAIDLLFLDIEMPVMNGFVFLDKILPADFDIIFTTAYDQYAIRAFQYSAINYLLKPITEKSVVQAIHNWEQRKRKINMEQWKMFQHYIGKDNPKHLRIALPTGVGYDIMNIEDIVRCQSENNYTYIHLENGSKSLICRTLKEVESILSEQKFIRVHRSHLINPKYVKTVSKHDGGTLIMSDGSEIPVSRQKRNSINEIMDVMLRFE